MSRKNQKTELSGTLVMGNTMQTFLWPLLLLGIMSLLTSCQSSAPENSGGSAVNSGPVREVDPSDLANSTQPGWSFPNSVGSTRYAFRGLPFSYTVLTGLSGSWSVSSSPALPAGVTASVTSGQLVVSGTPTVAQVSLTPTLTLTQASTTQTVSFQLIVLGDPLFAHQWHLNNDGASTFAAAAGTAGQDMSVPEAWALDFFGAGVRVAVSDSGVETTHTDLSANMMTGLHRNYETSSSQDDFLGTPSTNGEYHGTAVAGIIAAQGWNNKGIVGVAPMAKVAGFQFIDSDQTSTIILHQASGVFDVFNYSYGTGVNVDLPDDVIYLERIRSNATTGRSGKGQIYIKAAGNEYNYCSFMTGFAGEICAPQNANIPADNNSPYIIVVSALNADGRAASYSNAGSNIWVSGAGGEFGQSGAGGKPAMVSTDLAGCLTGGAKNGASTSRPFDRPGTGLNTTWNSSCDYVSTMNGTSSAAPSVAGVVALMLEANPAITYRDVKHILALTADQVHATATASTHPETALNLAGHTYEQGWVTNTAGLKFHNWYGFGRPNAEKAVKMAAGITPYAAYDLLDPVLELNPQFNQSAYRVTPAGGLAIPDANASGVNSSLSVSLSSRTVESVQVKITVTHPRSGQVGVELTSPSGTKSILLNINNALFLPLNGDGVSSPDANLNVTLTSHAFYGEPANGTWTLKVIDGYTGMTGSLTQWSLNMLYR